jgi:hypothetical protein
VNTLKKRGIQSRSLQKQLDTSTSSGKLVFHLLGYLGYLVEMRSFGGLSGSPVFVRIDPDRPYGGVPEGKRYYLLGVLRGHWNYDGPVQFPADESDPVNMGIAIVTPIADVLAILFSDEEVRWRRRQDQDHEARGARSTRHHDRRC